MTIIIEAIYESGVLKPINSFELKEHTRYRITVEELRTPDLPIDTALAAEISRRTTVRPDGRRVIDLLGIFDHGDSGQRYEAIEAVLDQARRETTKEWDELYDRRTVPMNYVTDTHPLIWSLFAVNRLSPAANRLRAARQKQEHGRRTYTCYVGNV